jgi:hypothetical protein
MARDIRGVANDNLDVDLRQFGVRLARGPLSQGSERVMKGGGQVCLSLVQLIGDGGSSRDCAQSAPCWAKISSKF